MYYIIDTIRCPDLLPTKTNQTTCFYMLWSTKYYSINWSTHFRQLLATAGSVKSRDVSINAWNSLPPKDICSAFRGIEDGSTNSRYHFILKALSRRSQKFDVRKFEMARAMYSANQRTPAFLSHTPNVISPALLPRLWLALHWWSTPPWLLRLYVLKSERDYNINSIDSFLS